MTPLSVIVVKPSSLGDIVHTLPAVHFLKSTFPQAEFLWIANNEWAPLLQDNSDLTGVIGFPRNRFRGPAGLYRFFRWCGQLSALRPDLVLDFQGLFRSAWMVPSLSRTTTTGVFGASIRRIDQVLQGVTTDRAPNQCRGAVINHLELVAP